MEKLHNAAKYLIKNFETYEEMQEVEYEINNEYFVPILEKINQKLSSHQSLPTDWKVDISPNPDEEEVVIYAFPASWEKWNGKDELGHVVFGNLMLSELLAKERDGRAWFAFYIPLANRRDEISVKSTKHIKELSKKYITLLEGYEISDDDDNDSVFYKLIDRMPTHVIESHDLLIDFVVENLLKVIQVVDKLNDENYKELKKLKS